MQCNIRTAIILWGQPGRCHGATGKEEARDLVIRARCCIPWCSSPSFYFCWLEGSETKHTRKFKDILGIQYSMERYAVVYFFSLSLSLLLLPFFRFLPLLGRKRYLKSSSSVQCWNKKYLFGGRWRLTTRHFVQDEFHSQKKMNTSARFQLLICLFYF